MSSLSNLMETVVVRQRRQDTIDDLAVSEILRFEVRFLLFSSVTTLTNENFLKFDSRSVFRL